MRTQRHQVVGRRAAAGHGAPAAGAQRLWPGLETLWSWVHAVFWASSDRGIHVDPDGATAGSDKGICVDPDGATTESGNIGVGFAIPMEQVKVTATQIVNSGQAEYPVIGAEVNTGSRRNGAEIVKVPSDTPADRAGLENGDIVVAVDDKPVSDGIGLIVAIRSHQPGETIRLTVRRGGEVRTLKITLDAKVG